MTQPNIVSVANIKGQTTGYAITGTLAAGLTNNTSSTPDAVYKVNAVIVANKSSSDADVDIAFYDHSDSTTDYYLAYTVTVPAKASLDLLNKSIYLEESDALKFKASTGSALEAVISYEIIS